MAFDKFQEHLKSYESLISYPRSRFTICLGQKRCYEGAMSMMDSRAALERLIKERREDYAALSRLIGRNPAYIQQFIKRGSPKRLSEEDRRTLARYFGIDEQILGAPERPDGAGNSDLVRVPRFDVGASAGQGALYEDDRGGSNVHFDLHWLRRLCGARPEDLSIIRVEGDSMSPTLLDGDEIMVNAADGASHLRDGVYVLRRDDALVVKRIAINPATGRVSVKSDNGAYPLLPECRLKDLAIIGRVVWAGRKVA